MRLEYQVRRIPELVSSLLGVLLPLSCPLTFFEITTAFKSDSVIQRLFVHCKSFVRSDTAILATLAIVIIWPKAYQDMPRGWRRWLACSERPIDRKVSNSKAKASSLALSTRLERVSQL